MKTKVRDLAVVSAFVCLLITSALLIDGCYCVKLFCPEKPPSDEQLEQSYNEIRISESYSSDALEVLNYPGYEVVNPGKKVVAVYGEKNEGRKLWFNMVGFDEDTLAASRKYLFIANEKTKSITPRNWRRLTFKGETALELEFLEKPFTSDDDKKIAVLKSIIDSFDEDLKEVKVKEKDLGIAGMLARQQLETVLRKLESSPALASRLDSEEGLAFEHLTFGRGTAILEIDREKARFEIYIHSPAGDLESPFKLR